MMDINSLPGVKEIMEKVDSLQRSIDWLATELAKLNDNGIKIASEE